jgi:transposase-like protein
LIRHLRDEILATYQADVVKARHMHPDGSYVRDTNRAMGGAINSQQRLIERATRNSPQR